MVIMYWYFSATFWGGSLGTLPKHVSNEINKAILWFLKWLLNKVFIPWIDVCFSVKRKGKGVVNCYNKPKWPDVTKFVINFGVELILMLSCTGLCSEMFCVCFGIIQSRFIIWGLYQTLFCCFQFKTFKCTLNLRTICIKPIKSMCIPLTYVHM